MIYLEIEEEVSLEEMCEITSTFMEVNNRRKKDGMTQLTKNKKLVDYRQANKEKRHNMIINIMLTRRA